MRKIACFTLIMLLGWQVSWAQDLLVKGVVTGAEDGLTIPGVSVVVKGTTNGTTTNFDGEYEIKVGADAILVFSYIGMKPFETVVGSQLEVNVALITDNFAMDEVVVVGYGVQKKSDITGSVASVKIEELEKTQVIGVDQALQGRAAGVVVTSNNGSPGAGVSVRIRGIGTINNADPLYVVDGFPMSSGIGFLSPSDIQSIEILKDASASAIYGSRAANGVVLITTKRGVKGESKLQVKGYYGIQQTWNDFDLLNAGQWVDVMTKSYQKGMEVDSEAKPFVVLAGAKGDTDWFDEITQTAKIKNINLSLLGGNEKTTYFVSGDVFIQEGVVKGSNYKRISFKTNADHRVSNKFKVGENLSISSSERKVTPGGYHYGVINTALKMEPTLAVTNSEGEFVSTPYTDWHNPVAIIDRNNRRFESLDIVGNVYGEYELFKGLSFKTLFGVELNRTDDYDFAPQYYMSPTEKNDVNEITRGYSRRDTWLWENTLTYHKLFNEKHDLTVLAGYTSQESRYEDLGVIRRNIPGNDVELQYVSAATDASPNTRGTANEWSIASVLGRVNYAYDDKYLLTASFRRDGSSRFLGGNQWGSFPAVSLGWKASNEEFVKTIMPDWMNSLKFRLGWGQIGNQNIALYQYATSIMASELYGYTFGADQNPVSGAGPSSVGNVDIAWEITESTNIGLDVVLLNNSLTFSAEYYTKNTEDMLLRVPTPSYIGWTKPNGTNSSIAPYSNSGKVVNKGFEFELEYRGRFGDLKYGINTNFATVHNEVEGLGGLGNVPGGSFQKGSTTRTKVGHSIGEFYGFVTDGIFQSEKEILEHTGSGGTLLQANAIPGDFRFKDINGDGVFNENDKTFIGSPIPDFTYGINLSLEYKGFDCSLFFQGTSGNEIFNATKYFNFDPAGPTNKSIDILNAWNGAGTSNSIPILNSKDKNDNLRISDFYVEDGSFIRLKTLQLGYTLPSNLSEKMHLDKLRIYLSGQNLLTFTDYSGLDPEVGQNSSSNYLSRGVDYGFYPQPRTLTVGVNVTF